MCARTGRPRSAAWRTRPTFPIEEIEFRTTELDPADEIVVYCHHGVRSAAVANFLRQQGFKAVNLAGGLDFWARAIDPKMKRY